MGDLLSLAAPAASASPDREPRFPDDYGSSLVIAEQPETFVFVNGSGAVAVRQVAPVYQDDPCVYVRPEHVERLCQALRAAAAEAQRGGGA